MTKVAAMDGTRSATHGQPQKGAGLLDPMRRREDGVCRYEEACCGQPWDGLIEEAVIGGMALACAIRFAVQRKGSRGASIVRRSRHSMALGIWYGDACITEGVRHVWV